MQTVNYLAALWGVAAIVAALYAAHCFRQDAERSRIAANRERRRAERAEAKVLDATMRAERAEDHAQDAQGIVDSLLGRDEALERHPSDRHLAVVVDRG